MGISPGPADAPLFEGREYYNLKLPKDVRAVRVESAPITLNVREGNVHEYWTAALEDANADVRLVAAQTLSSSYTIETRENLIRQLKDSDVRVRRQAAISIINVTNSNTPESPALTAALIHALSDADAEMRVLGIRALQGSSPLAQDTLGAILPLLRDTETTVRIAAAAAPGVLRQRGRKVEAAAIAPLLARLDDEVFVRRMALTSLGEVGAVEAIPAVVKMISDEDAGLRSAAINAAGDIGPAAKAAVPGLLSATKDNSVCLQAVQALAKVGCEAKQVREYLLAAYKSERDGFARVAIVRAMHQLCGGESIPTLLDALQNDSDENVRANSAELLGKLRALAALKPLVKALRDSSERVREAAVRALANNGKDAKAAVPELLVRLREDKVDEIRRNSASALGSIGVEKDAVPILIAALGDGDRYVRRYCAELLGNVGPDASAAIPALTQILKDAAQWERAGAERALKKIQAVSE